MKRSWMIGTLVLFGLMAGCDDDPQLVRPANRGQRGEACQARNDCESGLACVNGICSQNDFQISVAAKQCDQIDCSVDQDCCGDRPLEAPARCNNRDSVCETPYLLDCDRFGACSNDSDCGSGTCGQGYCTATFATCDSDTPCVQDTCLVDGYCSISNSSCISSADCVTPNVCGNRDCDCANPVYDPFADICTDPDCTDICNLRCNEERCVVDNSCEMDTDCFRFGLEHCDSGTCVACLTTADCDPDSTEICREGACVEPCTVNEQCPLFHACESGECVETGCNSDRECVLAFSTGGSSQDARLSKCLPSDEDPAINVCKIPCENDAACPREFEVCDKGFCTFIGCDTNEECRAYLGLEDQQMTPSRPYISTAECRE